MNYLINSYFHLVLPIDEISLDDINFNHLADTLSYGIPLISTSERTQTKINLENVVNLAQKLPETQFYLIINSDRSLPYITTQHHIKNINIGVYIPTEKLLHQCIYFNTTFNFGTQIELLRKLFIMDANPFVLSDADTILDPLNYIELIITFTKKLHFIRNSYLKQEIEELFYQAIEEKHKT